MFAPRFFILCFLFLSVIFSSCIYKDSNPAAPAVEPQDEVGPEPNVSLTSVSALSHGRVAFSGSFDANGLDLANSDVFVVIRCSDSSVPDDTATLGSSSFEGVVCGLAPSCKYTFRPVVLADGRQVAAGGSRVVTTQPLPAFAGYAPVGRAVDLGLSVLWSDVNFGAEIPTDDGLYMAWAENAPKAVCSEENYLFDYQLPSDICASDYYDVVHMAWGGGWRLPTQSEIEELNTKCKWSCYSASNGHCFAKVTGPNGNSITVPCAGAKEGSKVVHDAKISSLRIGRYFSGTYRVALRIGCTASGTISRSVSKREFPWAGCSIRPVCNL